ncbi:hypothetical protein [Tsukamurella tyrosinosolvens]|uniref:hypothetical protein n=1 Tax=Tsukamurella tyrosinosolvens TaxID=57704 RepID=UPI0011C01B85|nr:hypothetical protein [Tsukamurella tyrosinosolvens]
MIATMLLATGACSRDDPPAPEPAYPTAATSAESAARIYYENLSKPDTIRALTCPEQRLEVSADATQDQELGRVLANANVSVISVSATQQSGDSATVEVRFNADGKVRTESLPMKQEDGRWYYCAASPSGEATPSYKPPYSDVSVLSPDLPIDSNDLRQLAGFADVVFVATVTSTEPAPVRLGTPWTAVTVQVTEVLKGQFGGPTRVVQQQGGVQSGIYYFLKGEPSLAAGKSYLMSARVSPNPDRVDLISSKGAVELTSQNRQVQIDAMKEAIAKQIPFN